MSQNLPNMLEGTIAKLREMVDVNSVVGDPITTPDGVTIIPISKISVGFGGGGSDFVSKNVNKQENPFGGGAGGVFDREGRQRPDAAAGGAGQHHGGPGGGSGAGCAG